MRVEGRERGREGKDDREKKTPIERQRERERRAKGEGKKEDLIPR